MALSGRASPAHLASFWFGIQAVWGAVLAVSLQARSVDLAGADGVRAYASLAAAGATVAAMVQLTVGPFADARGASLGHRREFYLAGVLAALPALVWMYFAPAYWQLLAAFLMLQLALNVATGPYQASIPDHIPEDRSARASSWMSAFQLLGNALGLILAGVVADSRIVGGLLAALLAGSFAVTYAHLRSLPALAAKRSRLAFGRDFRTLLVSRAFVNLGFYTLLGFLFFFVRDALAVQSARAVTAGLFLSFTLAGIAGAALAARPADTVDKRGVVTAANLLLVGALAALTGAHSLPTAYEASVVAGIAWGAFFTADWALACQILPKNAMASAMGVWNVAAAAPQIVAPLIAAPLVLRGNAAAAGSGPRLAIALVVLEVVIGTLWIWRLPARPDRPRPEAS